MSEPDPDFVKWFGGDWQRRLTAVTVPGMADASWDRKAAWLLWCAERREPPGQYINVGLDGKIIPANTPNIVTVSKSVFD